jgi:hypothetical protein
MLNNKKKGNINNNIIDIVIISCVLVFLFYLIIKMITMKNKKFEKYSFNHNKIQTKYESLIENIGYPTYIEMGANGVLNSATWMAPLNNYSPGFVGGKTHQNEAEALDYIKINGFLGRKHHPIAANMYVISGKYIKVPEILIGPLKFASETINIEQLAVPPELNNHYGKTQEHNKKGKALVTGSCASVTISSITVKFVENMIKKYYSEELKGMSIFDAHFFFKREYDKMLLDYLCHQKSANIEWFNAEDYGESDSIDSIQQCYDLDLMEKKNNNNNNENFANNNNTKKAS